VSADALAQSVAGRLATSIIERQADGARARILLTGGSIATRALEAFAALPALSGIDASGVDMWWSDERFLPMGAEGRNDSRTREILGGRFPVPERNLHSIPGPPLAHSPEDSARQYAATLHAAVRPEDHADVPAFDIALLSIGEDGHVASLFPEHPALHGTTSVVAVHGAPKPPRERVSLALRSLCAATEIWLMASGRAKAPAVRMTLEESAGPLQVPAAGVFGRVRTLLLIDDEAAAQLPVNIGRPGS
jgi:6-phosphogluconolactonase